MKIKIAGLFMALLFCMTMIGASSAGNPYYNTKIGHKYQVDGGYNNDQRVNVFGDGLVNYNVKKGDKVKVEAYLMGQYFDGTSHEWHAMDGRTLNFYLYNSKGVEVFHEKDWTNLHTFSYFWDYAHVNIDTKNMDRGDYTLKVYYAGNPTQNPSLGKAEATSRFTIY
jgi:hypothetical protein